MKDKKKVLFVATVASHIRSFHIPYLKMFKEKGYEVYVAAKNNLPKGEKLQYCDRFVEISFSRSPYSTDNLKAIKQMKALLKKERFDIIHCHTPMGAVVTRLTAKKARKNGTRVIYTAHGFHFYKGAPIRNWLLYYPVEKYLAKYTDTLITINDEDYERAKKKFSKRCHDIQYVPGVGVDPKKFDFKMTKQEKHDLRAELGLKDDDFVMIFPAELSKRKNQIWLINTLKPLFDDHPEMHLLLPGSDSLNRKCQKLAKKLGLEKQVHFLGFRKDIPKLLKISNLAVSSSKQEGLPVNILEAKMAGLPVVALGCRGMKDILKGDNVSKIVELDDLEGFKKAILHSEKNRQNQILSDEYKKFNIENITNNIIGIYFRKKRVLHVLASNKFSGAENVACTIIQNLKDEYDFVYCSPDGPIRDYLSNNKIKSILIDKLTIRNLKKVIKNFNPDIVHAHDFKASIFISFIKKKKLLLLSHIHNNDPLLKTISIKSLLYLFTQCSYDRILTVSKSIEEECWFGNKIKNKIDCIGNPMKVNYNLSDFKDKEIDIICVARLTNQKNPFRFLNIIKEVKKDFPDISCTWVGDGELRQQVKDEIVGLGLQNNVRLVGFQKNVYDWLSKSKIFCLTSDYEGFGLSSFEALSVGLPCVVSKVGGLVDIVNSKCGYLCERDEEYVGACKSLLADEKLYEKKSKESMERAKKLSNIKKYISNIDSIYNEAYL